MAKVGHFNRGGVDPVATWFVQIAKKGEVQVPAITQPNKQTKKTPST